MKQEYLYGNYVQTVSRRIAARLEMIQAEHGFEYGVEFEVLLCEILREALPQKYGVCRGYVVDRQGSVAGDDIIIYSQDQFPNLRLRPSDDYSLKERIPIEAVYAYIEAKHSLILTGTSGASLEKACRQVAKVKKLVGRRQKRDLIQADPWVAEKDRGAIQPSNPLHPFRNPVYGAVISRHVRVKDGGDLLTPSDVEQAIRSHQFPTTDMRWFPDLILAGNEVVVLPAKQTEFGVEPTFFTSRETKTLGISAVNEVGFGVAFFCLFFALDWIRLGKMPFPEMIGNALGLDIIGKRN